LTPSSGLGFSKKKHGPWLPQNPNGSEWFKPNVLIFSACSHSGGQRKKGIQWMVLDPKKPALDKPGPECDIPMVITHNEIVIHFLI